MTIMANDKSLPLTEETQFIQQLKALHHHAITVRDSERKHISSYINDTVVQTLSALQIQLNLLQTAVEQPLSNQLTEPLSMIADLVDGLTGLARQLRPLELETVGLNEAIQLASEDFAQKTKITVNFSGEPLLAVPEAVATAFYRLAQEALETIDRQAQATNVWIMLQCVGTAVHLTIKDNGQGLEPEAEPGLGLLGLMVYFQQLNGRITTHSEKERGTTVTGVWPATTTSNLL